MELAGSIILSLDGQEMIKTQQPLIVFWPRDGGLRDILQRRELSSPSMQHWRNAFVIVLVAMALRMPFAISVLHQPGVNWRWGGEMFSIANAIVSGQGFSSPYFQETGPTAQETPGFPYFLAVSILYRRRLDGFCFTSRHWT